MWWGEVFAISDCLVKDFIMGDFQPCPPYVWNHKKYQIQPCPGIVMVRHTLPTESVFGVRMLHVLTDSAMAATVALLVIK